MAIIELRIHFTGSRRQDLGFGILTGLAGWVLGGLTFVRFRHLGLPLDHPWQGFGFAHLALAYLLLVAFGATVLWLAQRPRSGLFLGAMVITAATVPPLVGWALLVLVCLLHG